jgi:ATP-dependent Lhr-like helicase
MPKRQAADLLPERFADWFASRGWRARSHQLDMIDARRVSAQLD